MFDQSRVIVSSTTYCQGSQAEQLQWISRSTCWNHVCVQETLLTLVAPDTARFWVHYCKVHYSKIMPLLCQCHWKTTTNPNLICKPNMERRLCLTLTDPQHISAHLQKTTKTNYICFDFHIQA